MKPATGCILRTIGIEIVLIFLALAIYTGGESDIGGEIFLGSLLIILPFALISFVLGYFAGERVVPFEELSPLVRFSWEYSLFLLCFGQVVSFHLPLLISSFFQRVQRTYGGIFSLYYFWEASLY